MDDDFDYDHSEIVDLDVTGDPVVDQMGYQSPTRRVRPDTGFVPAPKRDWLAQAKADQRQREQRREEARRQSRPSPRAGRAQSASPEGQGWSAPVRPVPPPMTRVPGSAQPGQHGAYFERRTYRPWYAPWRKRTTWQQVSTWRMGGPPAGAEVVTVADVAQLPGSVRTIGRIGESGAVEY